jgi:hypothetical protein
MGYIRTNEEYYIDVGHSPQRAAEKVEIDKAKIDYGWCNPIKAKIAHEEEQAIRKKIKEDTG